MLKQSAWSSTNWATVAVRCGTVALGAALLSATALASAEAAVSADSAPPSAAQGMIAGSGEDAPVLGAEATGAISANAAADAPSVAEATTYQGKVIASTGLWVHKSADVNSGHVAGLPNGTIITVTCQVRNSGQNINFLHINKPATGYVDGDPRYVSMSVPLSKIPQCPKIEEEETEGTEGTELTGGDYSGNTVTGPVNGPVIIGSNRVGDITTNSGSGMEQHAEPGAAEG